MLRTLERFYAGVCGAKKETETFNGMPVQQGADASKKMDTLPLILALITILLLQLIIGKWLWNNFLVNAITVVKPLASILDILAISILAKLIFC